MAIAVQPSSSSLRAAARSSSSSSGVSDRAVVERALFHAEAQIARHQRLVGLDEDIEHGAVQILDAAAHLDGIAKALGGDHADLGAALGDQDVGAEGGAVDDLLDVAEELLQRLPVVLGGLADCGEEALGRVVRAWSRP